MTGQPAIWRPMSAGDLEAVVALTAAIHADHPERPEVFAERLTLFPAGSCIFKAGGVALGYGLAHPGRIDRPPALDTLLGALPAAPDCLYLHDVALLPGVRGQGLAAQWVARLMGLAATERLTRLALVAVNGSAPVWHRVGFRPWRKDHAWRRKVAS